MKKNIVLLSLVIIASCSTKKDKGIIGTWQMHKVIQSGEDVTSEHNPFGERAVIFTKDSIFESNGRPFGKNTGSYTFNTENLTLFLDSDSGREDDSYWNVEIKGDTMFWQGYGSEWAKDFQLIHVKNKYE